MVAISLYRGNLHRVPANNLRLWPMPPQSISLRDFKLLSERRSRALALIPPPTTITNPPSMKEDEGKVDNGCPNPNPGNQNPEASSGSNRLDTQGSISLPEIKEKDKGIVDQGLILVRETMEEDVKEIVEASTANIPAGRSEATDEVQGLAVGEDSTAVVKLEVSDSLDIVGDKENRKTEVEKKLQVLNEKKHHLVQMLKQILHAEEEIKRRSIQSPGFRVSIPFQPETAFEMGSVTRLGQKISIDVNFGGEMGGEADAAANHNIHPRNLNAMHSTSPSAASLTRPAHGSLQPNSVIHNPRATMVGHGGQQTPTSTTSASPSPFSLTVNQSSHAASLAPMSVPGTHFTASTPSPAASGGVSSAFRDSRLTTSL